MSTIWIKICGITRRQDAMTAADLGADAIGLNFYQASPRSVTVDKIAPIVQGLPEQTRVVALFVNPEIAEVRRIVDTGLVNYLQFHGDEPISFCEAFGVPYLKAIRVGSNQDLEAQVKSYNSAEMILLDSFDEKVPGGTGKVFDWSQAEELAKLVTGKLVMAGGLTPENVRQAITQVKPFGVDVSSGVEVSHGIKDPMKLRLFIEGARSV